MFDNFKAKWSKLKLFSEHSQFDPVSDQIFLIDCKIQQTELNFVFNLIKEDGKQNSYEIAEKYLINPKMEWIKLYFLGAA